MKYNVMQEKQARDEGFLLLFEYGLGGEIDGDNIRFAPGKAHNDGTPESMGKIRHDHLDVVKKLGLYNGFRLWCDATEETIRQAMHGGYGVHIDLFEVEKYRKLAKVRGMTTRAFTDHMVDHIRGLVKKHKDQISLNVFAEVDGVPWCYLPPAQDRKEALTQLAEFYTSNQWLKTFPGKDNPDGPAMLSAHHYLIERGIKPEELNVAHLCCQTFSPHLLYKLGSRAVWPEGNVGNNHQITIAFVRGAARQYRRPWFYDVAPFDCFTKPGLPMCYDRRRRRIAGFSESFILRAWLVSYLSGPKFFLFQASDMGFFVRDKDDKLQLTPLGEMGKEFADFCLRRHPNRGRSRAPVGLLLAQDHGYTTPGRGQPRLFLNKLPDDRANRSIEAFLRLAFPGFQNTHGTGMMDRAAWAPGGSWANQHPWAKPEQETIEQFGRAFREAIRDETFDPRPLEKALLTSSTWGDSFDVLVDNAPLDVLKEYPAIVLLGSIKVDDALRGRLKAYVQAGGKVLLNVAQVDKQDTDWLGIRFDGKILRDIFHTHSLLTKRHFAEGAYDLAKVIPGSGTECLILSGFLGVKGEPFLTRHALGKGEVWLVAAPDYMPMPEKQEITWLEGAKEAVDEFIRPHLALEVQGPPLEWLVNDAAPDQQSKTGSQNAAILNRKSKIKNQKYSGPLWVALINNAPGTWFGRIVVAEALGAVACRDIWNEKPVAFEYDAQGRVVLKPQIAAWEFKVIEIRRNP